MELVDTLIELVDTIIEQQKLSIEEKFREWANKLVLLFSLLLFAFFVVLFLSLALANWINHLLASSSLGYLIVSGVYILGLGIVWMVMKYKPKP